MSRVNRSVDALLQPLADSGSLTADDLEEARSHLLDSIEDLVERGLSLDEAVTIAGQRFGLVEQVAEEFHKVNPGVAVARRFYWMAFGLVFLGLLLESIAALSSSITAVSYLGGFTPAATLGVFLTANALLFGVATVCILRASGVSSNSLARVGLAAMLWVDRHPIKALLLALGATLLLEVVGRPIDALVTMGFAGSNTRFPVFHAMNTLAIRNVMTWPWVLFWAGPLAPLAWLALTRGSKDPDLLR